MNKDILAYNNSQEIDRKDICDLLAKEICQGLSEAENKVWHGHPVWFLEGNPIVGYSTRKDGSINLMFWSGQSFDEPDLTSEGSFKAAEIRYKQANQINIHDLHRWLEKSRSIQWDYKNIVKRRGLLERIS